MGFGPKYRSPEICIFPVSVVNHVGADFGYPEGLSCDGVRRMRKPVRGGTRAGQLFFSSPNRTTNQRD